MSLSNVRLPRMLLAYAMHRARSTRCRWLSFHEMIEKMMEVFMETFRSWISFGKLLLCVDKELQRIEVDKAKVDVIAKLPYPTTVKGVRSFLGHAVAKSLTWWHRFHGLFPSFEGNKYILEAVSDICQHGYVNTENLRVFEAMVHELPILVSVGRCQKALRHLAAGLGFVPKESRYMDDSPSKALFTGLVMDIYEKDKNRS
ncbi:hypothetical protein Tco_0525385 [Tanacetum coccineum]